MCSQAPGSCPGSFMTSHTGSVNGSSPAHCSCSSWNTRARPHPQMVYVRMTTPPGRRHDSVSDHCHREKELCSPGDFRRGSRSAVQSCPVAAAIPLTGHTGVRGSGPGGRGSPRPGWTGGQPRPVGRGEADAGQGTSHPAPGGLTRFAPEVAGPRAGVSGLSAP